MAEGSKTAVTVEDVRSQTYDFAGDRILCVYTYNPPHYVVYRTATRVMVHFSNDREAAAAQRRRIACLTPLRGQINGLIDGWHTAGDHLKRVLREAEAEAAREADRTGKREVGQAPADGAEENPVRKRALRYDRRVADAITLGLEDDVPTAMTLLAEIKNDIINERIAFARNRYLIVALMLAAAITLAATIGWGLSRWLDEPDLAAVCVAVSGGTLGALFSVAIGLKGRTVLIDLQNRVNVADACLRMLIGAMSGGMLLCLLLSGLVGDLINVDQLTPGSTSGSYKPLLVFVVGFLGGFFERLVPDLLSQTNFATEEARGAGGGTAASHAPAPPGPPGPPSAPATANPIAAAAAPDAPLPAAAPAGEGLVADQAPGAQAKALRLRDASPQPREAEEPAGSVG